MNLTKGRTQKVDECSAVAYLRDWLLGLSGRISLGGLREAFSKLNADGVFRSALKMDNEKNAYATYRARYDSLCPWNQGMASVQH